ncbi:MULTISPECIES: hypothetical protein [unclassified Klebsiella]|uniref:hypothetical protein n=1 Tax=unclassified Klebsiella TaxID=2608929 RepID=UPI0018D73825|nr:MULTISPECIES: hypothetical protein [unclassified Klebsiella]
MARNLFLHCLMEFVRQNGEMNSINNSRDKVNNMRDFNSGNINGDVTINDHSKQNEFKLLIYCDNDELISEEQHRLKILRKERNRKSTIVLKILAGCGLLMLFAGGWYFFHGQWDLVSGLTGLAGGVFSLATIYGSNTPTPFEKRQLDALQEINLILRERDFR